MKFSNLSKSSGLLLIIPLLAGAWGLLAANLHAATPSKPEPSQQTFRSPDEAVEALHAAAVSDNHTALRKLFGPDFSELLTGDAVQDANNVTGFGAKMTQCCRLVNDGEDRVTLVVGTNFWPFPIPLVKADGQWYFDTVAGKEEVINRHIGKDELNAIGVARAYVTAQRQYARMNPEAAAETTYARHFKSLPGKKDGLYWPPAKNEPASPFGPLVAEAQAEGYVVHARGTGPHPFHGYYFRILTSQGDAASGGKIDYLSDGNLTKGFALVAYPVDWGRSGIMTFIVNQDGKVYQRNLGEDTSELAKAIKEYNPDGAWTLVEDEGVLGAAAEK